LEPSCPDFLFIIQGFTTLKDEDIVTTVKETWNDETTNNFILSLLDEAPPSARGALKTALTAFIDSIWITRLDIRTKGNCLNPEFRVYAKGELIQDTKTWVRVRRFLANCTYINDEHGQGTTSTTAHLCNLCHGRDHPKGLCPFPLIEGWLGPKKDRQRRGHN
jgi:hypothetical protein